MAAQHLTAEEINEMVEQRVRRVLEAAPPVPAPEQDPAESIGSVKVVGDLDVKSVKRLVGVVAALAAIGPALVGAVLWFLSVGGDWRERELERAAEAEALKVTTDRLDQHIEDATSSWDEIKRATIENQVLIVDSFDHLNKKLDADHSSEPETTEPDSISAARTSANKAKAEQALFRE